MSMQDIEIKGILLKCDKCPTGLIFSSYIDCIKYLSDSTWQSIREGDELKNYCPNHVKEVD